MARKQARFFITFSPATEGRFLRISPSLTLSIVPRTWTFPFPPLKEAISPLPFYSLDTSRATFLDCGLSAQSRISQEFLCAVSSSRLAFEIDFFYSYPPSPSYAPRLTDSYGRSAFPVHFLAPSCPPQLLETSISPGPS